MFFKEDSESKYFQIMSKKNDPNAPYASVEPNPEFRKEVFGKNAATKGDKSKLGEFKLSQIYFSFNVYHKNHLSYI